MEINSTFFYPGKAFGKHPLKLSFFFPGPYRKHFWKCLPRRLGTGADQRRQESEDTVPGVGPGMPRDAPGWPPWPWDVQRVTWWLIKPMGDFSAAKESDFFRPTQLFCFFFTWLVVHDFYFPIYGMSSFPLTFICSRWLKPPTYQLNWWCFSMKNMGVSQLTWFHPEKPIGFSKARPFSWRASWGRSRKGPRRNFPRKGHGFPMGRVGGFPWGKPWKIMGNCGKMEVWMGNSLGNAGKILWSLIEVTELNGDEGFSSHGADYRKISDNILSSWILWGIWFGWFSQEIHDFGGIDI